MAYPPVDVVDENDNVVGSAMLAEVWQKGLRHRVVFVVVMDKSGRVLLQKRSSNMTVFPGCWDTSASGHVDSGTTYEQAAEHELSEEAPVPDAALEEVDYYFGSVVYPGGQKANRFIKIFTVRAETASDNFERSEVSELRWFTKGDINQLVSREPDHVAIGLKEVYARLWSREQIPATEA